MSSSDPILTGLVPDRLKVRSTRIVLESLEVMAEIGFHDFEIGTRQRLLVTVEVWLDHPGLPAGDEPASAWDYDHVRSQVRELAEERRYNLQETLGHAIFERVAAIRGVSALRVRLSKADVYPDAAGVGVEVASFAGAWPQS